MKVSIENLELNGKVVNFANLQIHLLENLS